jgi:hypothetical protein
MNVEIDDGLEDLDRSALQPKIVYGPITHTAMKVGRFKSERSAQFFLMCLCIACFALSGIIFFLTAIIFH